MRSHNAQGAIPQYFGFVSDALNPSSLVLKRMTLEEHIKASLRGALLTQVGERSLRPELGSTLKDFLFRPLVPSLEADLSAQIERALERTEPRVELLQVEVRHDQGDKSRLLVQLRYRVKETHKVDRCQFALQT